MPVTLDTTADFGPASAPQKRTLILAPPSIAAHEEKLRAVFTTYDRSVTDLQMLDRLSAGFVTLPASTYDTVLVLTDTDGTRRVEALKLLNRDVYGVLVPSIKAGGNLRLEDGKLDAAEASEAVLAGLIEKDGCYEKPAFDMGGSVPLKLGRKKKEPQPQQVSQNGAHGFENGTSKNAEPFIDNDDDLIDEDNLLSEEDLKRPLQQPKTDCNPATAKKRRRACKDCTCGLSSRLEAEDQGRQAQADKDLNVLKLKTDELNDEVDFTVQGKTGSCNSCSLGDAFRCDGCPYVGLPPFKPGEEVRIINDTVQL